MADFFKSIRTKKMIKYNAQAYIDVINREMDNQADIVIAMYNQITDTWDWHHPEFSILERRRDLNGYSFHVYAKPDSDPNSANNVFRYLDGGTDIRWSVMKKGFEPKTNYRNLQSGMGDSRAAIRGRSAMEKLGFQANPGIHAREWTLEIEEQAMPFFKQGMKLASERATRAMERGN